MADLSVIIVNWNTCQLLSQALASVCASADGLDLEVVVVDNGSSDGSAAMVRKEHPQVVLLENSENLGFTRGNNLGYEHCTAPLILFLNSDTIVRSGALRAMVAEMEANPRMGILGPRLLNEDGLLQVSAQRYPSLSSTFARLTHDFPLLSRLRLRERMGNEYPSYAEDMSVDWVSGACLLIRREAIHAISGKPWDERFFMYSEDVDLCYRVRHAGYQVCYFTGAEVVHLGRQSGQQVSQWSAVEQYTSQAKFRYLHYGDVHTVVFLIETFVLLALRSLLMIAGGLLKICTGRSAQGNWRRLALTWRIMQRCGTYIICPMALWEGTSEPHG